LVKKQPKGFSFFPTKNIDPKSFAMKRAFKNQNHIYHKPRGADKIHFDGRN